TIEVQTVPTGATVFLDEQLVPAKTPLSVELADGEYHVIRVEKPGYQTVVKKLKPDDTEAIAPVVLAPETQPRGIVYVESGGPAAVWIAGQSSGFMPPTPGIIVAAGDHAVEVRDPSGAVLDRVHTHVAKGETARLVLQLRPPRRGTR